jgi:hypothetical protein
LRIESMNKMFTAATHRFHDLRHTFGTRMAAAGVPMRTLQEWMGHRDLATTQIYADYAPSAHEAEMVAVAFARGSNQATHMRAVHLSRFKSGRPDCKEPALRRGFRRSRGRTRSPVYSSTLSFWWPFGLQAARPESDESGHEPPRADLPYPRARCPSATQSSPVGGALARHLQ